MFHPKIEDAEFMSKEEHLVSKVENFLPKTKNTLLLATYVFIEQNRKQFCLKEHIESKTLGRKVSQKSKTH